MIVAPVAHEVAAVGEQRVVGMHDRFGHAGRARGEGQIRDLVGVVVDRGEAACGDLRPRQLGARAAPLWQAPDLAHPRQRREPILIAGIGAPALLDQDRAGIDVAQQVDDLLDAVVAVQRGVADVAVARAGDERDQRLEPVREPEADPLAGPEAGFDERIGDGIDPARAARRRSAAAHRPGRRNPAAAAPRGRRAACRRCRRARRPPRSSAWRSADHAGSEDGPSAPSVRLSGRTSRDRALVARRTRRPAPSTPRCRDTGAAGGRGPPGRARRRRRGGHGTRS